MGGANYQTLAPFYDQIMSHVDYVTLGRHLGDVYRRYHGPKAPECMLELAAGTCRLNNLFPESFRIHSDLSLDMLKVATPRNHGHSHPHLRRVVCDVRTLPFQGPFDLIVMAYDSFNYLLQDKDMLQTLQGVYQILAQGGLFLFDVTTETCSRKHFADTLDFEELNPPGIGSYIRKSLFDRQQGMQLNMFTFYLTDGKGLYTKHEEIHRERIVPAAHLHRLALRAKFEVLACLSGFSFRVGTERSERLQFVLRRT